MLPGSSDALSPIEEAVAAKALVDVIHGSAQVLQRLGLRWEEKVLLPSLLRRKIYQGDAGLFISKASAK